MIADGGDGSTVRGSWWVWRCMMLHVYMDVSENRSILKDSKIEEITPIFQIEDANSVVQIEYIHVARVVLQGVSRVSWRLIWWQSSIQVHEKTAKKPREKSIFYSLSIRGVAEVALNQCSWGATYATNTVWGVPGQKMQKHLVKVVFAGLLPFEDFRMKPCKDGRNFR